MNALKTRLASTLLAAAFALAFTYAGIGTAYATGYDTHNIAIGSDRHVDTTVIGQAMSGMPDSVEYVSLIGDMVGSARDMYPAYTSADVADEIEGIGFTGVEDRSMDYMSIVWADHDVNVEDEAGIVFGMDGEGSGVLKTGYNADGSVAYYIYGIAFYELRDPELAASAAAEFEDWVDTISDQTIPILVFCHLPLHYARGDNDGAVIWSNALNYAATGYETAESGHAITRNVLYAFGHNHTYESGKDKSNGQTFSGEFFIPCGAEMQVGASQGNWTTIYYTYLTAGYLKQNKTATLLTIDEDSVTSVKYQGIDGLSAPADGVYDTTSKKSGAFASTFVTGGTNEIARVRPIAIDLGDLSLTLTDSSGNTLEVDHSQTVYLTPGEITARIKASDTYTVDSFTTQHTNGNVEAVETDYATYAFTLPSEGELAISIGQKERISLADAQISGIKASYPRTGKAIEPKPVVSLGGATLQEGTDYELKYKKNTNAGTATITVRGVHDYAGTAQTTFTIKPSPLANADISGVSTKTYTGKAITQKPTIRVKGVTLKQGTDYKLSYKNNVKAGTTTATVTGIGNYTGTTKFTFKINKASNPMKATGKTIKVSYAKTKAATQNILRSKGMTISKAQGKLSFKKVTGNGRIKINPTHGRIYVKKGTPKGTYAVKVKVTAAGNANYKAASKTVSFKVVVR